MKRYRFWMAFLAVLAAGFFCINWLVDWDKIRGKRADVANLVLPEGYSARVALKGLRNPASFAMDNEGAVYVAENTKEGARIVRYTSEGGFGVICEKLKQPISYIMLHRGKLYVSQKGAISMLSENGLVNLVEGLPSGGDYSNNGIVFGYDGMLYICQGAATNSGIVGLDNLENGWLKDNPYFHDYPPLDSTLAGMNFKSANPFSANKHSNTATGAFLPFGTTSLKSESIKGRLPATAAVMRMTTYGGLVDAFAWGIRNPIGIVILPDARVFISNQGMEARGSRPVAGGCDYVYEIKKNQWLGWPDYEGGEPVTMKKFKPKNQAGNVRFLLELHPTVNPPKPVATFKESGRIGFISLCNSGDFGYRGHLMIPLSAGKQEKAKIAMYDLKTGQTTDFATNKPAPPEQEANEQVEREEMNKEETEADLLENPLEKPVQCQMDDKGRLFVLENHHGILLEIEKDRKPEAGLLPGTVPAKYLIGVVAASFLLCIGVLLFRKK